MTAKRKTKAPGSVADFGPISRQGKAAKAAKLGHAACPYEKGTDLADAWLEGYGPDAKGE